MLCSCVKNCLLVWTRKFGILVYHYPPCPPLTIVKLNLIKKNVASEGWGSTVETVYIKTLDLEYCLLPKLNIPQFKAHLPFICTSINPGQMITLWQSICTSALTCSSQKIMRGSIIFPSRTQRSSVIISLSLKSRQFLNWYNFGCLSCVLFIL